MTFFPALNLYPNPHVWFLLVWLEIFDSPDTKDTARPSGFLNHHIIDASALHWHDCSSVRWLDVLAGWKIA